MLARRVGEKGPATPAVIPSRTRSRLRPHLVGAIYPASGLQAELIGGWSRLHSLNGLVDDAGKRIDTDMTPPLFDPVTWTMIYGFILSQ